MIISDKNKRTAISPKAVAFVLLAALLIFAAFLFSKKSNTSQGTSPPDVIWCDAENVEGESFLSHGQLFSKGATQSDEQALSGSHSSKVEKGNGLQFGLGYKLHQFSPGDKYRASVWRYRNDGGKGYIVVRGENGTKDFYKSEHLFEQTKNDWELLEIVFTVPIDANLESLYFYVYTEGRRDIYFDDLRIEKLSSLQEVFKEFQPDTLRIELSEKALQKLGRKRSEAFRNRVLETGDNDWVKGKILKEDVADQKMKLRLKGDWLDHLSGDKWSYRIKMGSNEAWNRLRYFSVQTPRARYYLHEWVLHQMYLREDVLTTYYDFILLDLNGTSKGVYAVEEHFDKVLVESKQRREGPILKFREDGFWEAMKRQTNTVDAIQHELLQNEKDWRASDVRAFGEKTILGSPALKKQFEVAQDLLHQFQYGKPVDEVFDLDRMAKYYAINDALGAYHGINWHNQRFYYNPVNGKIEPIGYDGFSSKPRNRTFFLGQGALNAARDMTEVLHQMLFQDVEFTARYMQYLRKFTSKEYLQNFYADIQAGLQQREALIQVEFEDYEYNEAECIMEAQGIHQMLMPQSEFSVKAHLETTLGGKQLLKVRNVNSMPIEIIGYGRTANNVQYNMAEAKILPGALPRQALKKMNTSTANPLLLDTFTQMDAALNYERQTPMLFDNMEVGEQAQYLYFRPLGLDTVFHTAIVPWPAPKATVPPLHYFEQASLETNEMYRVSDYLIYFNKGTHVVDQPLVFPKGYRIHFEAGTRLDLTKGAFFLSQSPVYMYGTEEAPVSITSSDKKGRGFHLMETRQESELNFVVFEYLNTISERGWALTGAVSFYEADAQFFNCIFTRNFCEDALNMIRSEFYMERCIISKTYADGLDSDFCKVRLLDCHFSETGNDGLDLSGSVIRIESLHIENVGDKGISVGEDTDATIFDVTIDGAPIGLAAKDLSTLLIHNIELKNCRQGFTAFQKKPEFGGSKIVVQKYTATGVKKLYNIQRGCTLQLEKKMIRGE